MHAFRCWGRGCARFPSGRPYWSTEQRCWKARASSWQLSRRMMVSYYSPPPKSALLFFFAATAVVHTKPFPPPRCCHSGAWADAVLDRMPFESEQEARAALDDCWAKLTPAGKSSAPAALFAAAHHGESLGEREVWAQDGRYRPGAIRA